MKPEDPIDTEEILALEAALEHLIPLFTQSSQLPSSADLLRRAGIRRRELAAERLGRWTARMGWVAAASLGGAAALLAFATRSAWAEGFVDRLRATLLAPTSLPDSGDAAVMAGAVLAASIAAVWVLQQFAEE